MRHERQEYGQVDTEEERLVNGPESTGRQAFSLDLRQHDTNGLLSLEDDDLPVGTIYKDHVDTRSYLRKRAGGLALIGAVCLLLVVVGIAIGVGIGQHGSGHSTQVQSKANSQKEGESNPGSSLPTLPTRPEHPQNPSSPDQTPSAGTSTPVERPPAPSTPPAPKLHPNKPWLDVPMAGFPLSDAVFKPLQSDACEVKGPHIPLNYLSDKFVDYTVHWVLPENLFYPNSPDKLPRVQARTGVTFSVAKASPCLYFHWAQPVEDIHAIYLRAMDNTTYSCVCNNATAAKCAYATCAEAIQSFSASDVKAISLGQAEGKEPFMFTPSQDWTFNFTHDIRVSGSEAQYGLWQSEGFTIPDSRGEVVAMLSTQLEPDAARLVMPCFDEPQYKGTFTVNLTLFPLNRGTLGQFPLPITPTMHTSLPIERPNAYTDQEIEFVKSPPMSTYTFGIAVGPIQWLVPSRKGLIPYDLKQSHNYKVMTWAPKGSEEFTELAAAVAWRSVSFYRNYTGIDNGLAKYELVAVESKQGAMESWGALMFDLERFLYNNATHGLYDAARTINVVCHEMAHQWFGNYATTRTWGDLVVNEGTATYMEYLCMQQLVPFMSQTVLRHRMDNPSGAKPGLHEGPRHITLVEDAVPDAPVISQPADAPPTFNVQTYSKGGSVLEMIGNFMAAADVSQKADLMQTALQVYLTSHAFGSATIGDLLKHLANQTALIGDNIAGGRRLQGHSSRQLLLKSMQTDKNVEMWTKYYATWMDQEGYPVVTVETVNGTNSVQVKASQARFCSFGLFTDPDNLHCPNSSPSSWWVPLATADLLDPSTTSMTTPTDLFMLQPIQNTDPVAKAVEFELNAQPGSTWTVSKLAACSPYRVAYPRDHAALLMRALETGMNISAACNVTEDCSSDPVQLDNRARALQLAASIVEDEISLGLSPVFEEVNVTSVLAAMKAAANSAEMEFGTGAYLLLNPVISAVMQLREHLLGRDDKPEGCLNRFHEWSSSLLANISHRLINEVMTADMDVVTIMLGQEDKNGPKLMQQQDIFFSHLLASRAASTSVLLEDAGVSTHLCQIFYDNVVTKRLHPQQMFGADNKIPADLRDAVYHAAAKSGPGCWGKDGDHSDSAWDLFSSMWELHLDPIESRRALFALAAIPEKSLDLLLHIMDAPGGLKLQRSVPKGQHTQIISSLHHASPDMAALRNSLRDRFDALWEDTDGRLQRSPAVWEQLAEMLVVDDEGFTSLQQSLALYIDNDEGMLPIQQRLLGRVKSNLRWKELYLEELCSRL